MRLKQFLGVGSGILLGASFMLFFHSQSQTDYTFSTKEFTRQIEQLKIRNDSLESRVEHYQYLNDTLTHKFNASQEKLFMLQKKKNEKIQLISTYSGDELFEFFSGFKTDSTYTAE